MNIYIYFVFSECSDVYKKCYIYFVFEYISWEDFQTHACEENGLSMVSFHSKEEQQYVGDKILRSETRFFYTLTKPSYLNAFMGRFSSYKVLV